MAADPQRQPSLRLPELPKRMMTIPEVAEYLNFSVRWVEDAVQQRRIRHTRFGKHVRIAPAYVVELLAAGEQPVLARADCHAPVPLHDRRRSRL